MNFIEYMQQNQVLFDGALGTQIQKLNLPLGTLPETINVEKQEELLSIHKAYVKAGSDVVTTNTFGCSAYKLKDCQYDQETLIRQAVKIAKEAKPKFVAFDIGPIGKMMKPLGTMTFDEAYEAFKIQLSYSEGADLILIETMSDLNEVRAAVLAAKEHTSLPVVATVTFQEDGRTLTGLTPACFVNALEAIGVDGLGVNCSLGPEQLLPIVQQLTDVATVPVLVQANAGLPRVINGQTTFDVTPSEYLKYVNQFIDLGVHMIGGCCGTSPEHISTLRPVVQDIAYEEKKRTAKVSSVSSIVDFKHFTKIGERINPTGHKRLKADLRVGKIDVAIREGIEQSAADVLDVNVGLPDIDELEMMKEVVDELASVCHQPLQIDSSKSKVLEAGLRRYPGVGIINSLNGKQKSMDKIFPIAKKYGAMIVCLTLDEDGIPETAEKRIKIAEKIINEAKKYGISEEYLIIDCLVLTVSAQQNQAIETMRAIEYLTSHYQVKTTLGISNVSFGMPNRPLLTRTFLTMALASGLHSAILDPLDDHLYNGILATQVLLNVDKGGEAYINDLKEVKLKTTVKEKIVHTGLVDLILKGYKEETEAMTQDALKTLTPLEVVNDKLIPALDEVGGLFDKKKIFLPQLIRAAETIGVAFDLIKEQLTQDTQVSKGKIIMATVYGDVHDIGKNLVKILLENYGYDVIDLGKDVPPEVVLEAVIEHDVKLVGLSALMTTTVISMEKTIKLINEHAPHTQVFVGGAVLTPEFSKKINADYYCKDAKASVEVAQEVL